MLVLRRGDLPWGERRNVGRFHPYRLVAIDPLSGFGAVASLAEQVVLLVLGTLARGFGFWLLMRSDSSTRLLRAVLASEAHPHVPSWAAQLAEHLGVAPSRARPVVSDQNGLVGSCRRRRDRAGFAGRRGGVMGNLLVHVTCGPESPTRAALGLLVARAAVEQGHAVNIFLAGDGVQLIRESVLDSLSGLGTGSLRESFDAVVSGGGRFYVSGMSSKARGVTASELEGKPAEMAMPDRLVQLAFEADRTLTY